MSQRVNIQFSIDLEELPEEVERLVVKFGSEVETTTELYESLSNDTISIAGLQEINELRLSLARADHILDDVNKIITGYMRMNTEAPSDNAEEQQATQMNPFSPNPDTLDNIEDKLRAFSERMKDEQSTKISDNQ
tara:strand:+ start:2309 stop:2713 length:405 start_codon:yes stop_codon:yes gene_type:complete